ncbi:(Fe-S)-binding protein [Sulfobacillus thermosulfidooxidans]|uniref:(Fe-S)-binding protein n=1 Tax=Sulfobacillus thermosulfidooxidans TaxID=28034 RepID=UPI0002EED33B|nr:(Fe-S)-binding protein [Sulfobacillus thermosulfidooxidans]
MKRVQLFVTCLADLMHPQAAIAAVHVLERRHVSVEFPEYQTCCGQFSYNAGYHHEAAILAKHFLTVFEASSHGESPDIVSLSGSCAAMVIQTYPQLLYEDALAQGESEDVAEHWKQRAVQLGERLHEWSMWLNQHCPSEPATTPKIPVAYHLGCHMRRLLPGAQDAAHMLGHYGIEALEPDDAEQCCGFGGTYSVTEPVISTTLADEKMATHRPITGEHGGPVLDQCGSRMSSPSERPPHPTRLTISRVPCGGIGGFGGSKASVRGTDSGGRTEGRPINGGTTPL